MNQVINIIENEIGYFNHLSSIDSYIVANRIKKVLKEKGYVMVENMKEADDYFKQKYGDDEHVLDVYEHGFDIVIDNITYHIKLHKYFIDTDQIYSVLVSECPPVERQ